MRYLVVHAHLYQPPRENPWTEVIERQPSAFPFHDWNERVSDECYERLGAAGAHGPDGRIVALVNLFSLMSFNIGPTLAAWLERERPESMRDASAGDRLARERTGFGAALMQPYGHPILPLCDPRERRLQIAWGRSDFLRRFGRPPEGVWLPECAVDLPTLEACADAGLRFTILAPEQVNRVRPLGAAAWEDVSRGRVPPHRPYLVRLPSGRNFTVFVFDGPLSRGAAFGGQLRSTEALLGAFRAALDGIPEADGLVLLAADGETFGHHQRHAQDILAEALVRAQMTGSAQVTHLGELAQRLQPTWELSLAAPSSWSCPHGVGRWERDCGCGAGAHRGEWNWTWRQVLRHAVTLLRDRVFSMIDRSGGRWFHDPWAAAEDYGAVLAYAPSPHRLQALLDRHVVAGLGEAERVRAGGMLELIRQTLFAATSCGWFFDDLAGLEAVQVLRHAVRAAELAQEVLGIGLTDDLTKILADAQANEPGAGQGDDVLRQRAAAARRTPADAAAAHAASHMRAALTSADEPCVCSTTFGAYSAEDIESPQVDLAPDGRVAARGRVRVQHRRTGAAEVHDFELISDAPGVALKLAIDGAPADAPSPPVREELLALASGRASGTLPAPDQETLLRVAWIAREAKLLGAPLPSPFPEAIRGGARALIQDILTGPPHSPRQVVRSLSGALAAARAAGLSQDDLADLRPEMDRALASLASWLTTTGDGEATADMAELLIAAREVVGEAVLSRLRRWLVDLSEGSAQLQPLVAAAGLAPDALVPLDPPPPKSEAEEDKRDALV